MRPDGRVVIIVNGRDLRIFVYYVLSINKDGAITTIDEYYDRAFEDGIGMGKYEKIGAKT
jgi:hypothetical protein